MPTPLYCELPIWGTLFEPLNTVSNLAFIIAAYFIWVGAKRLVGGPTVRQQHVLAVLAGLVGVGSFLWHFFRTPWGVAFDVLFINLFLVTFVWFLTRQVFAVRVMQLSVFLAFIAVSVFGNTLLRLISIPFFGELGGTGYLLPVIFALCLTPFIWRYRPAMGRYFLLTLVLFLLSLMTRQLDVPLCDQTHGHGLHLFWHLLNGYVLYRFAKTLLITK